MQTNSTTANGQTGTTRLSDEQNAALWAKRGEIERSKACAMRLMNRPGPFLDQAVARVVRLRREYDEMYAAAVGS